MSTGMLLVLLQPQAASSGLVREQCWAKGSASTNAAQNAAAIKVLRSWGSAFDALDGQDVCHMATRVAAGVREHLLERHGLDLDELASTLTMARLQRSFSPDGSGVLKLYSNPYY